MNAYFDYNAGAPLSASAADAMRSAIERLCDGGNPSSQHRQGRGLRAVVESARESVAALADATADEVVFTSCATEAAATVLHAPWDRVYYSGLDHVCVRNGLRTEPGRRRGREVPVGRDGRLDLDSLRRLLDGDGEGARLVALTAASHETGVLQPVAEAVALARERGAAVFCDASQALGRAAFRFAEWEIDYAGLSSSKVGGPAGVGALLIRSGRSLPALLAGGGQESRRRAGTENVVGIAGFGAAAASVQGEDWAAVRRMRDGFEAALAERIPGIRIFGGGSPRLPNVSCLALPAWQAAPLVMALDLEGYSVGAGSACSSGEFEPAQALLAMAPEGGGGASEAVRISFGPATATEELDGLLAALVRLAGRQTRLAA